MNTIEEDLAKAEKELADFRVRITKDTIDRLVKSRRLPLDEVPKALARAITDPTYLDELELRPAEPEIPPIYAIAPDSGSQVCSSGNLPIAPS